MKSLDRTTRRTFIKSAAAAGVTLAAGLPGCATPGRKATRKAPAFVTKRQKLRIAFIGTGGMGGAHVDQIKRLEDEQHHGVVCPCYCDVDQNQWARAEKAFPGAKPFQDYREMIATAADSFDAVMIGIPDHHHYPATILAMRAGKHVYTQKPLTHTPWEARQLVKAANKHGVVTQMGNQGHSNNGNRKVYEWVRSGALGDVLETHTWTDRPVWPQGVARPKESDPIPDNLDWDIWIGPAPERPYKGPMPGERRGAYHQFNWRGWWDFGAGALGDMACHTWDSVNWSLDPGRPTSIEPLASAPVVPENAPPERKETFPKASIVKWVFPANRWRPGFDAYWYDGHLKPPVPAVLAYGRRLPSTGSLFVGTKAMLLVSGDYGERPRIIPDSRRKEIGDPPKMLERSPGQMVEWILACKGDKPVDYARSNFAYAGPFTETILLGNIALRVGQRLEWDGANMRFPNLPEADRYVSKEYREAWDFGPTS